MTKNTPVTADEQEIHMLWELEAEAHNLKRQRFQAVKAYFEGRIAHTYYHDWDFDLQLVDLPRKANRKRAA